MQLAQEPSNTILKKFMNIGSRASLEISAPFSNPHQE